ncbi:MAG: SpoIIE family protein phosphatase [Bacteroidales bacterium]|nr:SpoIIE family protein phosphatase [Bacteroidales bacterium]
MKFKNSKALLLVLIAALTLEATSLVHLFFSQKLMRDEATMRAEGQLVATKNRIMDVVNQTEAAVRNSIWIAEWCLDVPDSLVRVSQRIVENNPVVVGSTVALLPKGRKGDQLFAPYTYRNEADSLVSISLATKEYDYPSQEWFTKPVELGTGYWSEPYVDEGGGEMLMTTYSRPLLDKHGKIAAVITADISLDWLDELVGNMKVYPHSYCVVRSRGGNMLVNQEESDDIQDDHHFVYDDTVERTGWSLSLVIPEIEVFGSLRQLNALVKILQLLGLAMLILMLRSFVIGQRRVMELDQKRERIEGELKIASSIQMSMIPKLFPPFPERKDIDIFASMIPAKEVGGDLYDFYIRDNKLFFCIGDVSGKGVPASLVMAVTRSLFRTVSAHENSPGRILTTLNDSMADMNDSNMFVTFFCGILDMESGHVRYCNAGHNAPVLMNQTKTLLPVIPNVPLGIVPGIEFKEQEADLGYDDALFLYTDGLTEAENSSHELFGEQRMMDALTGLKGSRNHLMAMQSAVASFVDDAPQSDDLTMLIIHYLNDNMSANNDRHLVIHNDIQQIPQLAEFVETVAGEMNLDHGLTLSLNLALEEAVTNVIMYAYPEGTDGLVDIEAIMREKTLTFIISDNGKEFDPTAKPDADITLNVEDRPIGGLGIYLVRNIMDSVSYERTDGKNILTMIKNI